MDPNIRHIINNPTPIPFDKPIAEENISTGEKQSENQARNESSTLDRQWSTELQSKIRSEKVNQSLTDPVKQVIPELELARQALGKIVYVSRMRNAIGACISRNDPQTADLIVQEAFQNIKNTSGILRAINFAKDYESGRSLIASHLHEIGETAVHLEHEARPLIQKSDPREQNKGLKMMRDSIALHHEINDIQKVGDLFEEMILVCQNNQDFDELGGFLEDLTKMIESHSDFNTAVQLANRFSPLLAEIQHDELVPLLDHAVTETLRKSMTHSEIEEKSKQAENLLERADELEAQGNVNALMDAVDLRNKASDIYRRLGSTELAISTADKNYATVKESKMTTMETATFQAVVNARNYQQDLNVNPLIPPLAGNAIDHEKANAWIDAHPLECRSTVTDLVESTRHIGFEEFKAELKSTVASFNQSLKLAPADQQDYIILVKSGKSNTWVTELSLPYLDRLPRDVIDLDKLDEYLNDHPNTNRLLYLDDGIYSGTQMSQQVGSSARAFEARNIEDYTIHVAAPFITNHGEKKLRSSCEDHLQIASHATMETIEEIIEDPEHRKMLVEMYPSLHGKLTTQTLSYFDHKIADYLSTLDVVYDQGVVMNAQGQALTRPVPLDAEVLCMPFIPKTISPYKAEFRVFHGIV